MNSSASTCLHNGNCLAERRWASSWLSDTMPINLHTNDDEGVVLRLDDAF